MNESLHGPEMVLTQASLPGFCPVEDALKNLSQAGIELRGAVFTRREVVEFILDLVGFTAERPLYDKTLLEPSFGEGDFLFVAVERLLDAWHRQGKPGGIRNLVSCIRGVELHRKTFESTRQKLLQQLRGAGLSQTEAMMLCGRWLVHGDFLLAELPPEFAFVVGNPPYVRQELIPDALLTEYRARYTTVFDRADLYIPFIERSMKLLATEGKAGIICADRWVKNRYGGPLRKLVAERFHLAIYVDMVDTPAFHSEVTAYPAIFVIKRGKDGSTRIARRPEISSKALTSLAGQLVRNETPKPGGAVSEVTGVVSEAEPWILDHPDRLKLVRQMERRLPSLEEAGCRVGIGVATGADRAFIGPYDGLDVEEDRKLPLATTRDIRTGRVQWRGLGVVNPFADKGGLVNLAHYPRLQRYLEERREMIAGRHVARKQPANWYRTIDRIHPPLATTPKLLIPDIKGEAQVVHEEGRLYPHHNLYFVTSSEWDLRALQAVLLSGLTALFITAYSTRMRGGYLRFQAQYLRRIRLPHWSCVPRSAATALIDASASGDIDACNQAVFTLYGLTAAERAVIQAIEPER
ncbi:MAG: Eco57I restriction-modification methylase domain-containing protein [Gemmatimonadota bacterium]|nr:Eco57I restriction-modification methylase domain-containing protein [Gemmatimonadota bacterium]